jgi:hypothetical protein
MADVTVVANVPLVGRQEILAQPFEVTEGAEYECGQTILIETSLDDDGFPVIELDVS